MPRQPRPLPEWAQFTALLLVVLQFCGQITPYDAAGNVVTVTDPDSHTVTNSYDALNRLVKTVDGLGYTITNTYDQVGNKLSVLRFEKPSR